VATIGQMEANLPELAKFVDNFVLDKVWSRKGLAPREKSLITISSQVAQSDWHQVEAHMKSFLHLGGTTDELSEVLLHLTVYCGFPGFRVLQGIKAEISSVK
jgi:4-carboxymuconolactone decarboxylase